MKSRKLLVFLLNFFAFGFLAWYQIHKGTTADMTIWVMWANGAAYIGGNVWQSYVKSRYFQEELVDK